MNTKVIGATKIERITASHAREQYAGILNEVAPTKIDDVIAGLEKYFAEKATEDLVECDVCKGWSTNEVDACPYCGEGGEIVEAQKPAPPAEIFTAETTSEPEPETVIEDPVAVLTSTEIVQSEPPKTPIKRTKKGAKAATAPTLEMVSADKPPKSLLTEADLDASIKRFLEAASNGDSSMACAMYQMGVELKRMRDELFQQRISEDGKPKYKSFNQFVKDELDVSKDHAYRLMRIVENFTIEQFQKHGPSVLKVLSAAPKEDHPALLERAEAGASVPELSNAVRQIREDKGITSIETDATRQRALEGKAPTPTTAGAAARKKEAAAITLGLKTETANVVLYARQAKAGDEPVPARTLEDQPWGKLEGINGVTLYFVVKAKPTGELVARVTAKREEDEDEKAAE